MATPQTGIFALGTRAHHHLEFNVHGDVHGVLATLAEARAKASSVVGANVVVGLGPAMLGAIDERHRPEVFVGFETIEGTDGFVMPAGQHDVWVWLHGSTVDGLFDVARSLADALAGDATLAAEQQSYVYGASRDLTGFEDGTENPPIDDAVGIATLGPGKPGAGGSIALVQRWRHDLTTFDALDTAGKERAFGRTLADSIELDDEVQSPGAHVARVVIRDDEGEELEVFRRSTAFGDVSENGLQFIAFSADQERLDLMLRRMAGTTDGVRDHICDFSTPTASAWYFTPPVEAFAAGAEEA